MPGGPAAMPGGGPGAIAALGVVGLAGEPLRAGKGGVVPAGGNNRFTIAEYRERLVAIYTVHKPDHVPRVEYLLRKYTGQEEFLYQSVCSKYRVDPDKYQCPSRRDEAMEPAATVGSAYTGTPPLAALTQVARPPPPSEAPAAGILAMAPDPTAAYPAATTHPASIPVQAQVQTTLGSMLEVSHATNQQDVRPAMLQPLAQPTLLRPPGGLPGTSSAIAVVPAPAVIAPPTLAAGQPLTIVPPHTSVTTGSSLGGATPAIAPAPVPVVGAVSAMTPVAALGVRPGAAAQTRATIDVDAVDPSAAVQSEAIAPDEPSVFEIAEANAAGAVASATMPAPAVLGPPVADTGALLKGPQSPEYNVHPVVVDGPGGTLVGPTHAGAGQRAGPLPPGSVVAAEDEDEEYDPFRTTPTPAAALEQSPPLQAPVEPPVAPDPQADELQAAVGRPAPIMYADSMPEIDFLLLGGRSGFFVEKVSQAGDKKRSLSVALGQRPEERGHGRADGDLVVVNGSREEVKEGAVTANVPTPAAPSRKSGSLLCATAAEMQIIKLDDHSDDNDQLVPEATSDGDMMVAEGSDTEPDDSSDDISDAADVTMADAPNTFENGLKAGGTQSSSQREQHENVSFGSLVLGSQRRPVEAAPAMQDGGVATGVEAKMAFANRPTGDEKRMSAGSVAQAATSEPGAVAGHQSSSINAAESDSGSDYSASEEKDSASDDDNAAVSQEATGGSDSGSKDVDADEGEAMVAQSEPIDGQPGGGELESESDNLEDSDPDEDGDDVCEDDDPDQHTDTDVAPEEPTQEVTVVREEAIPTGNVGSIASPAGGNVATDKPAPQDSSDHTPKVPPAITASDPTSAAAALPRQAARKKSTATSAATQRPAPAVALAQAASPRPAVPQVGSEMSRAELVRAIFSACDGDNDGFLGVREMMRFSACSGFDGNELEWAEEYEVLCSDNHIDVEVGVDVELLAKLVDDESDRGCYCTDDELRSVWAGVRSEPDAAPCTPVASSSTAQSKSLPTEVCVKSQGAMPDIAADVRKLGRAELIRAVFHACDADCDALLSREELLSFSSRTGFHGTGEEWAEEYEELCEENSVEVDSGVDIALFARLVDDDSDTGCYCSDDDLAAVLAELGPKAELKRAAQAGEATAERPSDAQDAAQSARAAVDGDPGPAQPPPKRAKAEKTDPKEVLATMAWPDTIKEWGQLQSKIWEGHAKLAKGWIRIWSKSKGCEYYLRLKDKKTTFDFDEVADIE